MTLSTHGCHSQPPKDRRLGYILLISAIYWKGVSIFYEPAVIFGFHCPVNLSDSYESACKRGLLSRPSGRALSQLVTRHLHPGGPNLCPVGRNDRADLSNGTLMYCWISHSANLTQSIAERAPCGAAAGQAQFVNLRID